MNTEVSALSSDEKTATPLVASGLRWLAVGAVLSLGATVVQGIQGVFVTGKFLESAPQLIPALSSVQSLLGCASIIASLIVLVGLGLCWIYPHSGVRTVFVFAALFLLVSVVISTVMMIVNIKLSSAQLGRSSPYGQAALAMQNVQLVAMKESVAFAGVGTIGDGIPTLFTVIGLMFIARRMGNLKLVHASHVLLIYLVSVLGGSLFVSMFVTQNLMRSSPVLLFASLLMVVLSLMNALADYWFIKLCLGIRDNLLPAFPPVDSSVTMATSAAKAPVADQPHPLD